MGAARILGSLGSAGGKGVVRMEDRVAASIDDVWSALTDRARLASWYGEVEGDLRLGGEYRARLHASGWEGTGRVDACELPRHLLITNKQLDSPDEGVLEITLAAEAGQTIVVWQEQGMPVEYLAAYGPASRSTSRISSPTWPDGIAATARRAGTNSSLLIKPWPLTTPPERQSLLLRALPPVAQLAAFAGEDLRLDSHESRLCAPVRGLALF